MTCATARAIALSIAWSMLTGPRRAFSQTFGLIILSLLLPYDLSASDAEDRWTMRWQVTELAFALAAYRADHGNYPAKLTELVPKYIQKSPPTCSTTTPTCITRRKGGGYRLYSVGPNGVDNGGRGYADRENSTDPPPDDWDDIGVRVGAESSRHTPCAVVARTRRVRKSRTAHGVCLLHVLRSRAAVPPSTMAAMRESPDNLTSPASSPTAWRNWPTGCWRATGFRKRRAGHPPRAGRGVARSAGRGLSRPLSLVRQPGGLELPDQRQERAVRRGLRLLLAVAGLEGRESPLPLGHRRTGARRRPAGRPARGRKPTAPSSPAGRRATGSSTRCRGRAARSRPSMD